MYIISNKLLGLIILMNLSMFGACKKFVQIPEPITTITTSETFSTDATATAAVIGLYKNMNSFSTTLALSLSADEIVAFSGNTEINQLQTNTLLSTNSIVSGLWNSYYSEIYQANAIIEGLKETEGVSDGTKSRLLGEAKFIRAFYDFYLINVFGDVPLVMSTDWKVNSSIGHSSSDDIYRQIIADLKEASNLLPINYALYGGERTRVTKSAADAFLARVYLFTGDFVNAEALATLVINNNSLYKLVSLNNAFLKNNDEAIWQLEASSASSPFATMEGNTFVPTNRVSSPSYYITSQLFSSFESNDKRKFLGNWIDTTVFLNVKYYFPYKYKIKQGSANVPSTEYAMVLRLAEQFLIRAEARAEQGNLSSAISDMDSVRTRAGLPKLSTILSKEEILVAVAKERRAELFVEWGHRWLDLKRTGQATNVLSLISTKQPWFSNKLLFPIPQSELVRDPNLVQNSGYDGN